MHGEAHEKRVVGPSRGRGVAVALTVCLALAAVVGAATAPGHQARFDTRVKVEQYAENAVFLGHVRSELRGCKRKRVVVLWKQVSGPDERIGRDRSDRSGLWAVAYPDAYGTGGGTFYAKAKRRVITPDGHRHVCKRDRSPNFVI